MKIIKNCCRFIIIGISTMCFISCNNSRKADPHSEANSASNRNSGDIYLDSLVKAFRLDTIKGSQIRAWFEEPNLDTSMLLLFHKKNGDWTGRAIYYRPTLTVTNELVNVNFRPSEEITPPGKFQFNKILDSISAMIFRHFEQIPEFSICNDGGISIIEVLDDVSIQKSEYPCWQVQNKSIVEILAITKLLGLARSELQIKVDSRIN